MSAEPKMPSLAPGFALFPLALVLIVVLVVNPGMPGWLRITVAIVAIALILTLLIWAGYLMRAVRKAQR